MLCLVKNKKDFCFFAVIDDFFHFYYRPVFTVLFEEKSYKITILEVYL